MRAQVEAGRRKTRLDLGYFHRLCLSRRAARSVPALLAIAIDLKVRPIACRSSVRRLSSAQRLAKVSTLKSADDCGALDRPNSEQYQLLDLVFTSAPAGAETVRMRIRRRAVRAQLVGSG